MNEHFAASYVDPQDAEDDLKEAVEEWVEEFKAEMATILDEGFSIFAKQPSRIRLAYYEAQTLPVDRLKVLDPDYFKKAGLGVGLGLYDPLVSPFWMSLMPPVMPDFVFERLASDFRNLVRERQ